jgi:hypothetical protein
MMKMTPAALKAALEGDIDNFLAASTSVGIEAQEKRGQQELAHSDRFPLKISGKSRSELEDMGFQFGKALDGMFQECKLPSGWKVVPTDHSMWSDIVDGDGKKRGSIFFKAAFYDYHAEAYFE